MHKVLRPLISIPPGFSETASSLLSRVQRKLSPTELVFTSHPRWPLPLRQVAPVSHSGFLRIAILDSSFNPPTLAHLALANAPPLGDAADYEAKLLLLSVRNADKSLKPSDATYLQRLEMMYLLSRDIIAATKDTDANIAIAVIDEPTFVGKSKALFSFFQARIQNFTPASHLSMPMRLTFLQGFDTLERFFSPRYYSSHSAMMDSLRQFFSPAGDNSMVVCAWRGSVSQELLKDLPPLANDFIRAGSVALIDIDETARNISSTQVRSKRESQDDSWERLVTPRIAGYLKQQA